MWTLHETNISHFYGNRMLSIIDGPYLSIDVIDAALNGIKCITFGDIARNMVFADSYVNRITNPQIFAINSEIWLFIPDLLDRKSVV